MSIKKNKFTPPGQSKNKEIEIEKIVNRGGSEPQKKTSRKKRVVINILIPEDFLNDLDDHLNQKRTKPSRIKWILEAIDEKLQREQV